MSRRPPSTGTECGSEVISHDLAKIIDYSIPLGPYVNQIVVLCSRERRAPAQQHRDSQNVSQPVVSHGSPHFFLLLTKRKRDQLRGVPELIRQTL